MVYEMRALWEDAAVDHGTYGEGSWKYNLIKRVETWVCRRADHVTVLCSGLCKDLVQRGIPEEKLTIIPNGVDTQAFHARDSETSLASQWKLVGKKVIGFIGSFFRYEGLDILIDAMAHLGTARPDVVLLLVGGGEMEDEIKDKVRQLGLQETVIMPGPISPQSIPEVYALVDIFAYPRRSMRLTELVTPLKPLEAMAMTKAVVASDIGGHRELINHGHTGWLFPAGSVSELVKAIAHLLDSSDTLKAVAEQGNLWVRQERSWERTTAGYGDAYSAVLQLSSLRSSKESSCSTRS